MVNDGIVRLSVGRRLVTSVGATVGTGRRNHLTLNIVHVTQTRVHRTRVSSKRTSFSSSRILTILQGRIGRQGRALTRVGSSNESSLIRRARGRVTILRGCLPPRVARSTIHTIIVSIVSTLSPRQGGLNATVGTIVTGLGKGTSKGIIGHLIQSMLN